MAPQYDYEFEEWAKINGYDITRGNPKTDLNRPYRSHFTTHSYRAWQAAMDLVTMRELETTSEETI